MNNFSGKKNEENSYSIFSDIFKYDFNVFERFDIVAFGRILYEMATGRELKNSFPDELELKDMDLDLSNILRIIFMRYKQRNQKNSKEIKIDNLLNLKFFNTDDAIKNERNNESKF